MCNSFCNSMFEMQIARKCFLGFKKNIECNSSLILIINSSFIVGMTYGVIDVIRGKGFLDPPPALICRCSALTEGI